MPLRLLRVQDLEDVSIKDGVLSIVAGSISILITSFRGRFGRQRRYSAGEKTIACFMFQESIFLKELKAGNIGPYLHVINLMSMIEN